MLLATNTSDPLLNFTHLDQIEEHLLQRQYIEFNEQFFGSLAEYLES